MRHTVVDSPLGPLTLVADGDALTGLYMAGHHPAPRADRWGAAVDVAAFEPVVAQLAEYFAGQRRSFDLPLRAVGTPFQLAVWAAIRAIPYGGTTSYGAIATGLGNPAAVRAVGLAVGRNPLSVVVPCHRVVGAGGALTGYAGGLPRKELLLALERRTLARHP